MFVKFGAGRRPGTRNSLSQSERIHRNLQRFRGGLVSKAHRLCVSLNCGLESNNKREQDWRRAAPLRLPQRLHLRIALDHSDSALPPERIVSQHSDLFREDLRFAKPMVLTERTVTRWSHFPEGLGTIKEKQIEEKKVP